MQTVNIDRVKLLEIVKENRTKHIAEFKDAMKGYRAAYIGRLNDVLEVADTDNGLLERDILRNLPEPENHEKEYDRVIRMLELSADPLIELSDHEFNQYVLDEWVWAARAKLSNSYYSALNNR